MNTPNDKLTKRLAKAKTNLVLQHPFVGTLAMNMPFILTEDVPTAATNGKWVKFNPSFIEALTDEELTFLVGHECMHPMLEHNYRRYERTPKRWNHAGDYIINYLLTAEKIGKMPDCGLYSKALYDEGGTTDGIYNLLPEEDESGDGDGNYEGTGSGMDECQDGEGTQTDRDQQASEMRVRVAQAAQAAKMMGKLSANMARLVDEVLNPKVDWRDVLQQFVEKCKDDRRTWARPNRRFIPQGLYLPSADGEAMGPLVFGVDCSGSCWDAIPQFGAEVRTVHEDQKPRTLHVIYFDSSVSHVDEFTRDDDLHIEGHGGGGTAFSPIFKYIEDNDIEPVACVILTDLCCSDYGDVPPYPVLWVSNDRGGEGVPFGQVVMM
jgi:predicted metal-dependent peptidase